MIEDYREKSVWELNLSGPRTQVPTSVGSVFLCIGLTLRAQVVTSGSYSFKLSHSQELQVKRQPIATFLRSPGLGSRLESHMYL